ncbi:MAG TPA: hypothetical protein VLM40_18435, partial [Gemmata sp.]|nr:hypothetical protein [Gemmata sp.]
DRNRHTATFADLTIAAAPLSITRGSLVIESRADGSVAVRGEGPATTDLNRLGKSLGLFSDPLGPNALRGNGAGRVQFQYSGDVVTFGGNLDVADFAFGPEKEPEWFEKRLRVEVDGSYTRSSDTLAFKSAMVERRGLSLAAAGTIGKFDSTTDAKLDGTLSYDMDKLTPKLRELLGGNFAATGKGSKILSLAGNLTPEPRPNTKHPPNLFASIKAELGIGWDSLKAYGFDVGSGELQAKLADGFVRFTPIHATFGGGKVTLNPAARLDPAPGGVTFAKGKIVDRARLTPEVCASALGFALPAIAHSNKIEGEVSITLGDNHIPLADTSKSTAKAVVLIHKATLTAGPVIGEVARLLGADRTTMTLADGQSVSVRVENGRVYHDGLTIKVGGYLVKTSGSVGFDGSVDLVVDAPIPGGLPGLKNTPSIAKALTGKRVSVPIRGTLSQPALDARAFQLAIAKLAQSAAKDIGRDLLNRELKKLFPEGMPAPGGFFPVPKK